MLSFFGLLLFKLSSYHPPFLDTFQKGCIFSFKFVEGINPFNRTTDTSVWDFWWHLSWVSQSGWILHMHALLPSCHGFLRFICGETPADPLMDSMAAEPVQSKYMRTSIGGA